MCLPTSYLHMMMDDKFPQYFNVPEMNLAIRLPEGKESKSSIMAELSLMESQMMQDEGEVFKGKNIAKFCADYLWRSYSEINCADTKWVE